LKLGDQRQLVAQLLVDLGRHAGGIARRGVAEDQLLQPALGVAALRHGLVGIFVGELREVEIDAGEEGLRLRDGLRRRGEKPGHFGGGFQVALGVGLEPPARRRDGFAEPHAGQRVLKIALAGRRVERVVEGDQRQVGGPRQGAQAGEAAAVGTPPRHGRAKPERARRRPRQAREHGPRRRLLARRDNQQQVARVGEEIVEAKVAFALLRPRLAHRQQAAQPRPARAVFGIGENVRRAVGEDEPRAHDELEVLRARPQRAFLLAQVLQGRVGAHDTGDGIDVGQSDAAVA
jgi:hypothetical protein